MAVRTFTGSAIATLRAPLVIGMLAHGPLALAMRAFPGVATLHVLVTLLVGLKWAWKADFERTAMAAAYVTGAEVLWRMVKEPLQARGLLPWELGKYAVVLFFVVAMCRKGKMRGPGAITAYFAFQLPSALLTFMDEKFDIARQRVSFNLAGPLALMIAGWFFSHFDLAEVQLVRLFLSLILPMVSIATIVNAQILENPDITFMDESNEALSGGFGPNQVSAILGLGAFLALWCALHGRRTTSFRFVMSVLAITLATQSALTFSRGGLYAAGGGALLLAVSLLCDRGTRSRMVVVTALSFALGYYVIVPSLDEFTQGTLVARFQDTNLTHRSELIETSMETWQRNFLFGLGPGQLAAKRALAAHTEFARMLAEHGLLGCGALAALILAGMQIMWRARTIRESAALAAMMCWGALFMFSAAMRLVAPSFMFGLAFVRLRPLLEQRVKPRPAAKPPLWRMRNRTSAVAASGAP